jgi:CRISPR/Cas system-associated exonuclease Cas4 (RecB family)
MFNHVNTEIDELESVSENGKRFYLTPDGNKYPSVTTVTSLYTMKAIMEWRKRVGEEEANRISGKASHRGTRVHLMCEDYLSNRDHINKKVMPNHKEMFGSIQPYLDKIDNIHTLEGSLYSHHLRVAGRVDCIGEYNGRLAIIDFKTANRYKEKDKIKNYFMQASAYAVMFEERTGIPVDKLVIIGAVEGEEPFVYEEKRDNYIKDFVDLRAQYTEKYKI